jgi:esterase/lipase
LGDKVLVISCSTGSTLSTWFGTTAESSIVDAMVFVSPNFGLKNKFSELINWPWGQSIAKVIAGDKIEYQSSDPREAVAWTQSYPTRALFPMMALVKKVRNSDLSRFQTPVFVLYSAQDQTVEPFSIKEAYARMGSKIKAIETVDYSRSEGQHVLAGDIRDPQAVGPISQSILKWIKTIDQ